MAANWSTGSTRATPPTTITRREPVTKFMSTTRLRRGFIAAAVAGLALSSVVLSTAASAATIKLPASGVETPSGGTVTETGSTLLYPLFNLWASGYSEKYPKTTIQTAGTGSGTGISEAQTSTIDIGASDAYLAPSVTPVRPASEEHSAGHLGAAGRVQRARCHRPHQTQRQGALRHLPGSDHQMERLEDRQRRTRA